MPDGHATSRRFYGSVRRGDEDLGEHFCELTVDPYSTHDMRVVVYMAEEIWLGRESPESFFIAGPGIEVETFPSSQTGRSDRDGGRLSFLVESIRETMFSRLEVEPAQFDIGYRFPITTTTRPTPFTRQDGDVGFIRGTVEEVESQLIVTPPSKTFLHLDGVEIEVGSTYDFARGGGNRYPEEVLVTESYLGVGMDLCLGEEATLAKSRVVAEGVLDMLSVLERDRIVWTRERVAAYGADGEAAQQWTTTRRVAPAKEQVGIGYQGRSYLRALARLVEALDTCDAATRSEIARTCYEFGIASTARFAETQLVHWHSVLDFFCKRLDLDDSNTKRRINRTCRALNVDLEGLVGATELSKPMKEPLPFTRLRNQFIHDGFDVFDGKGGELLNAIRTARALAERMLLATLGIGGTLKHLGTTEGPF